MSSAVTPAGHGLLAGVDHDAHRPSEDLATVHLEVAADLGVEEPLGRAVGVEVPAEELAGALRALQHHGARAVGEEHGRVAVLPVGDAGQGVGADEEHLVGTHRDEPVGEDEPVDEARQAALMSKAPQRRPSSVCTVGAVAGTAQIRGGGGEDGGDDLARLGPAISIALRPDSADNPAVVPPTRRSRMPVRSRIHSSEVSIIPARSSLVRIFGGSARPSR